MRPKDLDTEMRGFEAFHSLRVPPESWIVIRADGRSFSKLTRTRFEKPFDETFSECMAHAAETLLKDFSGIYAYTESDEISLLLPFDFNQFGREVEKLVSISAGVVSSAFSLKAGVHAAFDSRIWMAGGFNRVLDYFRWRQNDAARCCLNSWCHWTLLKSGLSPSQAQARTLGMSVEEKNELLFQHGTNFDDIPPWQRRGVGIYWETYVKKGFDPKLNAEAEAIRRRVRHDRDLPMKEAYAEFLAGLASTHGRSTPC